MRWQWYRRPGVVLNGLIGYWKLQDGSGSTAADSSGNGHNGTLVNNPTWVAGGLQFVGASSQSVNMGVLAALAGLAGASLCCWFNRSGGGPTLGAASSDNNRFEIIEDTSTTNFFTVAENGLGQDNQYNTASNGLHHYAMVFDGTGGTSKLYVDAAVQTPIANAGAVPATISGADPFSLGIGSAGGVSKFATGTMSYVRLYNRALSSAEVSQIFNSGT